MEEFLPQTVLRSGLFAHFAEYYVYAKNLWAVQITFSLEEIDPQWSQLP